MVDKKKWVEFKAKNKPTAEMYEFLAADYINVLTSIGEERSVDRYRKYRHMIENLSDKKILIVTSRAELLEDLKIIYKEA